MMRMLLWDVPFHILITSTLLFSVFAVQVFSGCIHDSIQSGDVPKSVVSYEDRMIVHDQRIFTERTMNHKHDKRVKRAPADAYKPIRITVSYQKSNMMLTDTQKQQYKAMLEEVVRKASSLLSVIPVSGNLLLNRNEACKVSYKRGPNRGKCARVKTAYRGEFCADDFKIPDKHLEGVFLYGDTNPQPVRTVVTPGSGLSNTDFVLYVRASSTPTCVKPGRNIIAYGSYCQLDQNDRPIAGFINFCPSLLKTPHGKIRDVALHELFHTLGFSKSLFEKYKDCSQSDSGRQCSTRPRIIKEVLGWQRLVTPAVVKQTSQHFKCQDKTINFGAILEKQGEGVGSHWDAAFLQGSIMTPNIKSPELTVLDNITLAAFEDTGWYKVDYSQAQPYSWGLGMGCRFAVDCGDNDGYFCSDTGSKSCHFMHLYKGECKTSPFLHTCKIYQHIPGESCRADSPASVNRAAGELYDRQSRCFVANLTVESQATSVAMAGYCYQTRCTGDHKLEVRVADSGWNPCPYGKTIQIRGYKGILKCPRKGVLCVPRPIRPPTTTVRTTVTSSPVTSSQPTMTAQPDILCIEIVFLRADYKLMEKNGQLPSFKQEIIKLVVVMTKIPEGRMKNIHFKQGSVVFIFDLLAKKTDLDGPPSAEVYNILKSQVDSGNFTVYLTPNLYFRAEYIRSMLPNNATDKPKSIPAGGIVGIVLGTMATMCLIVVGICLVNKYQIARTRVSPSPSRTPSVDMSDSVSRNTITTLRAISVTHAHSAMNDRMELQQV